MTSSYNNKLSWAPSNMHLYWVMPAHMPIIFLEQSVMRYRTGDYEQIDGESTNTSSENVRNFLYGMRFLINLSATK